MKWLEVLFEIFQHSISTENPCDFTSRQMFGLLVLLNTKGQEIADV